MGKRFCRLFQTGMKGAMYLLPWSMPKLLEGPGKIKELPALIKSKGYDKVLLVTDKTLLQLHLADSLLAALDAAQVEYVLYDGVSPNPTDVQVEEGVALYGKHQCQALIAFGGGSPMDCAKVIGARIARPHKPVRRMQGLLRVLRPIPTIFAVPTTAGTGSETTIAAVITSYTTHHKASITDLSLMPKYAVLDPELTVGLPPQITATTGMDALCHAVEAYTNHTYNTKLEQDLCRKAVKLIYDNLYTVYLDGSNLQARQNMQRAAFYAGRAFTRGSVGYVHAIGHTLGGLYGTPHGLAMSILLPRVMRQFGPAAHHRLAELCDVCGIPVTEHTTAAKAEAFLSWIEELNEKMGIPAYPPVLKVGDIDQIAQWAYQEGNPLYPVPVVWSKDEFKQFILSLKG